MLKYVILLMLLPMMGACKQNERNADALDYQLWTKKADHASKAKALQNYLKNEGVDSVFPIHELLRSDVKWKKCGAEPFSVPPQVEWPNIVPTLRIIRDQIIPLTGPVEALSVYRQPQINTCIKGAKRSQHMTFQAIDMQPRHPLDRDIMISRLCKISREQGAKLNLGLGIYRAQRFHIDAAGYRKWGSDYKSSSSPCRSLVAPQHKSR